ncbi:hypothetical protein FRC01_001750 [Tulasnella sp. 417]|nr:hypothetical protein FRC01_001750 [Tulasnella sp. 417]
MQVQDYEQAYRSPSYSTALPFKIRHNGINASCFLGTNRLTKPIQVRPNSRDVVSSDELPQNRISFLDLPEDIFLGLLVWLEMSDIFNLRRACKRLKTLTQLHSSWVVLATCHVIGNKLPWPAWALPLSEVPSVTLEHLTLRALRMERLWDLGSEKTERKLSRFIQRPWESITWIRLIRSRWLVIQQGGATLELWDLEDVEYKQPNLTIDSVEGIVDGSVVRSKGESAVTMIISTRSCEVRRIEFSLPYPKDDGRHASARVVDSFTGFSRLMDADEQLEAFLQYEGRYGNFIRNTVSGVVACLGSCPDDFQPQQSFAIQIKSQVVAVASAWSVDLYWRESILTTLQSAGSSIPQIQPFQKLTYLPGCPRRTHKDATIASARFLANNPGFTSLPPGDDAIFFCAQENILGQTLYVAQLTETTPGGPPTYMLLPPIILFWSDPYTMLFYDLGQSCRRSVFVVDDRRGLSLCGVFVPLDLSLRAQELAGIDSIGWWRITDSTSRDLVHHVAFEEATGTCAVAMGSGRVWVADLTASEIITQKTGSPLDIPVS